MGPSHALQRDQASYHHTEDGEVSPSRRDATQLMSAGRGSPGLALWYIHIQIANAPRSAIGGIHFGFTVLYQVIILLSCRQPHV